MKRPRWEQVREIIEIMEDFTPDFGKIDDVKSCYQDPLDEKHADFNWQELYEQLGEVDEEPRAYDGLVWRVRQAFSWLVQPSADDWEGAIARRVLVLASRVSPGLLAGRCSQAPWASCDEIDALFSTMEPGEAERLTGAFRVILGWLLRPSPTWEKAIARRALALAWTISPDYFEGGPSLTKLAGILGQHKMALSRYASAAHRTFGISNRAQSHGSNFKELLDWPSRRKRMDDAPGAQAEPDDEDVEDPQGANGIAPEAPVGPASRTVMMSTLFPRGARRPSWATVTRLILEKVIPATLIGRRYHFNVEEVRQAWLASGNAFAVEIAGATRPTAATTPTKTGSAPELMAFLFPHAPSRPSPQFIHENFRTTLPEYAPYIVRVGRKCLYDFAGIEAEALKNQHLRRKILVNRMRHANESARPEADPHHEFSEEQTPKESPPMPQKESTPPVDKPAGRCEKVRNKEQNDYPSNPERQQDEPSTLDQILGESFPELVATHGEPKLVELMRAFGQRLAADARLQRLMED